MNLTFHSVFLFYDKERTFSSWEEKLAAEFCVSFQCCSWGKKKELQLLKQWAQVLGRNIGLKVINPQATWKYDYTKDEISKIQYTVTEINQLTIQLQGLSINMYLKRWGNIQVTQGIKQQEESRLGLTKAMSFNLVSVTMNN